MPESPDRSPPENEDAEARAAAIMAAARAESNESNERILRHGVRGLALGMLVLLGVALLVVVALLVALVVGFFRLFEGVPG